MATDVTIPPLGESITEASVGQWFKAPGEAVKADEPIVSLETDKVAVEVPSPIDGVMGEQLFKVGDTVAVGATIARIDGAGSAPAKAAAPVPAVVRGTEAAAANAAPTPVAAAEATADAASANDAQPPSVRRIAAESGVDPATVEGSGKDGRVTKGDMQMAVAASAPAATPQGGYDGHPMARPEERVRMTRIRQTIAKRLKQAQDTAAMLTTFNDVDMTAVMAARSKYKDVFEKKHGVRLGFMSFFVKASVLALREVPSVNAMIDGDEIVYRNYADISVAVSGAGGLVVPVLRDAHSRSFAGIETAIGDFGKRAQAGTLKLEEMQGGTFTISNGGVFGSLMSTPILNPPQSGVLGLHRIEDRPVARDGQVVIRPMMYLALSYDHRLVDGREAVTFLVRVKEAIEDPARLLLDL